MKARIQNALFSVARHAEATVFAHFEVIRVMSKPTRTVVAKSFITPGSLVLVPETSKIGVRKTKKQKEEDQETVGAESTPVVRVFIEQGDLLQGHEYFVQPMFVDSSFVSVAWAVKTTTEEGEANMGWSAIRSSSVEVFDLVSKPGAVPVVQQVGEQVANKACKPKCAKASAPNASASFSKAASAPKASAPNASAPQALLVPEKQFAIETVMQIPILVNLKPLEVGTELVVNQAKATKKARGLDPIKTDVLLKKAKVETRA